MRKYFKKIANSCFDFIFFVGKKLQEPWVLYILFCLLFLPFLINFFKVFLGLFAFLTALISSIAFLFFLAPNILKKIIERGVIKKNNNSSTQGQYIKIEKNSEILIFENSIPNSISLNILRGRLLVKNHDILSFKIIISTLKNATPAAFYINYDETTLNLSIDQDPSIKGKKSEPYTMTILIPETKKMSLFSARIIDGFLSLKHSQNEALIETLDIDAINTKIKLETLSLPIFKINGLNLDLSSDQIFIRYLYLNAASSILRLNFDSTIADFYGKIKCHSVLSKFYLNKKILKNISGTHPHTLWSSKNSSRSIMISANLLRTTLKILIPESCSQELLVPKNENLKILP